MSIAFTTFDELFHFVQRYAASVPHITLESAIREAAIDFCQRTRCWRWTESVTLAGSDIELSTISEFAQIFEIDEVRFEGRKLRPVAYKNIPQETLDETTSDGAPDWVTQDGPGKLSVYPSGRGKLNLSLFIEPLPDAQVIQKSIADRFGRHFAEGGIGNVLLTPDQPYSNPTLAGVMLGRFEAACGRYATFNLRGQQRAPVRTRSSWC